MHPRIPFLCLLWTLLPACTPEPLPAYADDYDLVAGRTEVVELTSDDGRRRLLITPAWQGRILTTTFAGQDGPANGWFNRELIREQPGITGGVGGEDRVWISPLGSQHSFYYGRNAPLSDTNWSVPATMEQEPYGVVQREPRQVVLRKEMQLTNFIGTELSLALDRRISLLSDADVRQRLHVRPFPEVASVAFSSEHRLINTGTEKWSDSTGLAGVWSAGMFAGTDGATVIVPLGRPAGREEILTYFGELDEDRLWMEEDVLYFRGDGRYRSKIGIPPGLAPEVYACYFPERDRLTIIRLNQYGTKRYGNSAVTVQEDPYTGEVIPIYNDGPLDLRRGETASFIELESTSAVQELAPGDAIYHFHEVYHFGGKREKLDRLCREALGVGLPGPGEG